MCIKTLLAPLVVVLLASQSFAFPVEVRSCDRDLVFERPPRAAVSNDINITEMMLVLGLEGHMVGYTDVPDETGFLPQLRPQLSNLKSLSPDRATAEVLLEAGADFYFAGWNYGLTVGGEVTPENLERFGIAVYELTESCIHVGPKTRASINDLYADLLNLGKIFGVERRAEHLVASYRRQLRELRDSASADRESVRVFVYDSGENTPFTAGRYAMPTALIEAAGGRNVFDDFNRSWATVGWEAVIDRDPEIVVIVDYGNVTAEQKWQFMITNPAFRDLTAVRNNRFVVLDYIEATPGPQNIGAIRKLSAAFHTR